MDFVWNDYDPNTMNFVESWLDESAVESTGLDDGFRSFYAYWANEDGYDVGENFWCKVISEYDNPFAIVAFCWDDNKMIIMEVLLAPEKRGQGKGPALIKELINNEKILGFSRQNWEAVIYPSNIASCMAFEKAGFRCSGNRKDENGDSVLYAYKGEFESAR